MSEREWFPPGGSWFRFPSHVISSCRGRSAAEVGVLMELAMGCWSEGGPISAADVDLYVSDPALLEAWIRFGAVTKTDDGYWCPWLEPSLRTLKNKRRAALDNLATARRSPRSVDNTGDGVGDRFVAGSGHKSPSLSSSVASSSKETTKRGAELREFLGEHAPVVDALDEYLGPNWARAVMGLYGPSGTAQDCYPQRKSDPVVLASALNALLAEPNPSFHQGFFAKLIKTAGRGVTKADEADETFRIADARHESQAQEEARRAREDAEAENAKKAAREWYDGLPPAEQKAVKESAEARALTLAMGFGSQKPTSGQKRAAFIAECQERMGSGAILKSMGDAA